MKMKIEFCAAPGLVVGTRHTAEIVQTYEQYKDVMWRLNHVLLRGDEPVAVYWPKNRF